MKYYEAAHGEYLFRIVPDNPDVGAYLHIYRGDEDLYDYLQDSVKHCMDFAYRKFGVLPDAWIEAVDVGKRDTNL
ncbi:MAG: hypothetical protein ABI999_04070 [Acidobacteriota bacterium]